MATKPPRDEQEAQVRIRAAYVPLGSPAAFASEETICLPIGATLGFLTVAGDEVGKRTTLPVPVFSVSHVTTYPEKSLVAFSEEAIEPRIFVYDYETNEQVWCFEGAAELALADLSFSGCGTRLYALARARTQRLSLYSLLTGQQLPSDEIIVGEMEKVTVYPRHKDIMAVISTANVHVIKLTKSFKTYIVEQSPPSLPEESSLAAYAWTNEAHLIVATLENYLYLVDASTADIVSCVSTEGTLTCLLVTPSYLVTVGMTHEIKCWLTDFSQSKIPLDHGMMAANAVMMGDTAEYVPKKFIDASPICERDLEGSRIVQLDAAPSGTGAVATTTDGSIWYLEIPVEKLDEEGADDEEEEEAGIQEVALQSEWVTWTPTSLVTCVSFLSPNSSVAAAATEEGTLRFFDTATRPSSGMSCPVLSINAAINCMCTSDGGSVLIVGTEGGSVLAISTSDWQSPALQAHLRIASEPVTHVAQCKTPASRHWWVAVAGDKIAFLRYEAEVATIDMLGLVDVPTLLKGVGAPSVDEEAPRTSVKYQALCWQYDPSSVAPPAAVLGATYEPTAESDEEPWPILVRIQAPSEDYRARDRTVACEVTSMRVDAAITCLCRYKSDVLVGTSHGDVRVYSTGAMDHVGLPVADAAVVPPSEVLVSGLLVPSAVAHLADAVYVASVDGYVRKLGEGPWERCIHDPYQGGVYGLSVATRDGDVAVASTGGLDGVLVWSPGTGDADPLPVLGAKLEQVLEITLPDQDPWEPQEEEVEADLDVADQDAAEKAILVEVEDIRRRLRTYVNQNTKCADLEKLERKEFCVDEEMRDHLAEQAAQRSALLQARVHADNVRRQVKRSRLLGEFWETMKLHGMQLVSLTSGTSVANFPSRSMGEEQSVVYKQIDTLRLAQQRERLWHESGEGIPARLREDDQLRVKALSCGKESYIVNWWKAPAEPADGDEDDAKKGKKKRAEEEEEAEAAGRESYLFSPLDIMTSASRRMQTALLERYATETRDKFTTRTGHGLQEKKNTIAAITDKIVRVRKILNELGVEETVPEPELHELEDPKTLLTVDDKDISATKYLTAEEKDAKDKAEAAEKERLRKLSENDASQRALAQMMGGTLKTKKDLSPLEIVLEREDWMDEIDPEDMNEAQQATMKEYEERAKQLKDEQDKYRKELEKELKKLRQDIQELLDQFDARLKDLQHDRCRADMAVFCQEVYAVRLHLALLQQQEDLAITKRLETEVDECAKAEDEAKAAVDRAEAELRRTKADLTEIDKKEKGMGVTFKAALAAVEVEPGTESFAALNRIFRTRSKAQSDGSRWGIKQEFAQRSHLERDPDPYPDEGVPLPENIQPKLEEIPEGVEHEAFMKTIELRKERWQFEEDIRKMNVVRDDLEALVAAKQEKLDLARHRLGGGRSELEMHIDTVDREWYDIELLFFLKQGHVEVPQAAVVTDYADAAVVEKTVIEKRNARIREIAKEKVKALHTVKDFRKRLRELEWHQNMLALRTTDLEERTKDVHMLRVTKDLQSLLHGQGEESRIKAEADMLERKIEHLTASSQRKEEALKATLTGYNRAVKGKQRENSMLSKKLAELQQSVIQREHIRRLRAPSGGDGQMHEKGVKRKIVGGGGKIQENDAEVKAAMAQFWDLKQRRAVMDQAKRHTEEIDALRKELDRMRQRTFPSFVRVHDKHRNPDQR